MSRVHDNNKLSLYQKQNFIRGVPIEKFKEIIKKPHGDNYINFSTLANLAISGEKNG